MQFVDPNHGSSLKAWKDIGSPASPSRAQIEEMKATSALPAAQEHAIAETITLQPQGLAVLEIRAQQ